MQSFTRYKILRGHDLLDPSPTEKKCLISSCVKRGTCEQCVLHTEIFSDIFIHYIFLNSILNSFIPLHNWTLYTDLHDNNKCLGCYKCRRRCTNIIHSILPSDIFFTELYPAAMSVTKFRKYIFVMGYEYELQGMPKHLGARFACVKKFIESFVLIDHLSDEENNSNTPNIVKEFELEK